MIKKEIYITILSVFIVLTFPIAMLVVLKNDHDKIIQDAEGRQRMTLEENFRSNGLCYKILKDETTGRRYLTIYNNGIIELDESPLTLPRDAFVKGQ